MYYKLVGKYVYTYINPHTRARMRALMDHLHVALMLLLAQAAPTVYPVYVNLSECYNQGGSLCVSGSVPPEAVGRGARSMVR